MNITLDSSSFFLTQYGEEGGEEDNDDARKMTEHKEQQEKKEEKEINHQNMYNPRLPHRGAEENIRPFIYRMFAYYLLGELQI